MAINAGGGGWGLEKSLNVNKQGVAIRGDGWKNVQGECISVGCYRWGWRYS